MKKYDAGTIDTVAGSSRVIGNGTNWLPEHDGARIKIGFEGSIYIFHYISDTEGELSLPAENNLASAKYALWGEW